MATQVKARLLQEAEDLFSKGKELAQTHSWISCVNKHRWTQSFEHFEQASQKFEQLKEYVRAAEIQLDIADVVGRFDPTYKIEYLMNAARFFEKTLQIEDQDKALAIYQCNVEDLVKLGEFNELVNLYKSMAR